MTAQSTKVKGTVRVESTHRWANGPIRVAYVTTTERAPRLGTLFYRRIDHATLTLQGVERDPEKPNELGLRFHENVAAGDELIRQDALCPWGWAMEEANAARPAVFLPTGWSRVFRAHWDCAPAFLIYKPGHAHLHPERQTKHELGEPTFTVHDHGVEIGGCYGFDWFNGDELAAVAAIAANDHRWLNHYRANDLGECDHSCMEDPP